MIEWNANPDASAKVKKILSPKSLTCIRASSPEARCHLRCHQDSCNVVGVALNSRCAYFDFNATMAASQPSFPSVQLVL